MRAYLLLLLGLMLLTSCGDPAGVQAPASDTGIESPAMSEAATESSDSEEAVADGAVRVETTDLGAILVDGEGRTLYLLTTDKQGASTCYDDCEDNWPVLPAPAQAGEGVDAALLGETERTDGSMQATYNDWPLYYFAGDAQAGDLNGQGVGDVWFVIDAAGEPVKDGDDDEETRDY